MRVSPTRSRRTRSLAAASTDTMLAEREAAKRSKGDSEEGTVVWRLSSIVRTSYGPKPPSTAVPPPQTPTRRFHVSRAAGNVVLFEAKSLEGDEQGPISSVGVDNEQKAAGIPKAKPAVGQELTSSMRKRPGAGTALRRAPAEPQKPRTVGNGLSAETIRKFEKFSLEVESGEVSKSPRTSPSKTLPKAPQRRFKDRHPEKATELGLMDVDTDEYVYDTYIREVIMPDAAGKVPEPQGIVGYIILSEEDEEWWYDEDQSDREFDTDDEDENAEDYYANDYPEDEMDYNDEFDRQPYRYYHGENNEEYDLDDEDSSDEESDEESDEDNPFRQVAQKPKATGYWGLAEAK